MKRYIKSETLTIGVNFAVNKKYELTDETINVEGHILHRIRALIDFDIVSAGDLGGFVESYENLSQNGDCWVGDNAKVYEDGVVYDDALVYGDAYVYGNADVYGCAIVHEYAEVYENADIHDDVEIGEYACVHGNAVVYGDAYVHGDAEVYGSAALSSGDYYSGTIDE